MLAPASVTRLSFIVSARCGSGISASNVTTVSSLPSAPLGSVRIRQTALPSTGWLAWPD